MYHPRVENIGARDAFPIPFLSLEARLLPGERVWQTESLFLVFRRSKMGVAEMGVVTMLKLVGY